jgi:hypothetical protein
MPRYRMKWRHARWETWTFYTEADSEQAARAKFDTGDIEQNFDRVIGGYVDFIEPETMMEAVSVSAEADGPQIASPATIADRLHAAMAARPAKDRISIEDWIVAARAIGPVVIERYEDAYGERFCKLTFDDASDVKLSEPVNDMCLG